MLATSVLHAQTKPLDQTKIDIYLDRARNEIARWPGPDAERFAPIPSMHDVGALLMYARGNAEDRQAVTRLIDMPMKLSPKMTPKNRELSTLSMQVALRAALGERESLVKDVQRILDQEEPVVKGWPTISYLYWGLIGDKQRCVAGVKEQNLALIASFLMEAQQQEIAQAVLDQEHAPHAGERATRRNRQYIEMAYARGGLPGAIDQVSRYQRIDDRIEVLQGAALYLAQSDRREDGRALLDRALRDWDKLPDPHYAPNDRADELFDAGYTDYAQKAFDQWRSQRAKAKSASDWWYWSDVAATSFVLGRPELLADAQRELRKLAETPDSENPENNIDAGYALAAAQILAGKRDEAMRTFAATRKTASEENLAVSESFWRIGDAMRRVEDFDAAMKLATDNLQLDESNDLDHEFRKAIEHLIRAKRFGVAWKECNKFVRLWNVQQQCRLLIALELIRSNQEEQSLRLIESLESPTARAALYVFIARDVAGTRLLGNGRISYLGF